MVLTIWFVPQNSTSKGRGKGNNSLSTRINTSFLIEINVLLGNFKFRKVLN